MRSTLQLWMFFMLSLTLLLKVYGKENSRLSSLEEGGPVGWKAVDRFEGFRYEWKLFSPLAIEKQTFLQQAQKKAKELECFGWIQAIPKDRIVGEARCPKGNAEEWIQYVKTLGINTETQTSSSSSSDTGQYHMVFTVFYANTKIRYHFSHFRVLSDPRYLYKTCFKTRPHACSDLEKPKSIATSTIEINTATTTVMDRIASTVAADPSRPPSSGHSQKDEL